jgi:hypothetical protein
LRPPALEVLRGHGAQNEEATGAAEAGKRKTGHVSAPRIDP